MLQVDDVLRGLHDGIRLGSRPGNRRRFRESSDDAARDAGGDEINISRKGRDYGWPTIAYGIEYRGGPITGGITADLFPAWKGSLFVGGHATNDLVRLTLEGKKVVGEERLLTDLQPRERLRDVRQGPDGALYLLTDNAKGRIAKLFPKRSPRGPKGPGRR